MLRQVFNVSAQAVLRHQSTIKMAPARSYSEKTIPVRMDPNYHHFYVEVLKDTGSSLTLVDRAYVPFESFQRNHLELHDMEVPEEMEERGLDLELALAVLDHCLENYESIVIRCPYLKEVYKENYANKGYKAKIALK